MPVMRAIFVRAFLRTFAMGTAVPFFISEFNIRARILHFAVYLQKGSLVILERSEESKRALLWAPFDDQCYEI